MKDNKKKIAGITTFTGICLVIANMIGTGAFTSLGFQLESLTNTAVVLSLWILGGVLALCGAFSYAEIGTQIKKSGGEYAFLSRIYHPVVGYLSGWISLSVGFAAPVALSAIALIEYFPAHVPFARWVCVGIIAAITLVHSFNLRSSSNFQNVSTVFKVVLIGGLILLGFIMPAGEPNAVNFEMPYFTELGSVAFAVSLIYVSYSYSGWNAAAYISEEFRNPLKALPVALIGGTLIVTILYTLLQLTILRHVPMQELIGKLNVGTMAVEHMLGPNSAKAFGLAISLILISGISAMVWVGSRVTSSIASEHSLWRYFQTGKSGIPVKALWLQFAISAVLVLTGTFEQIMIYCGILLTYSTLLVVIGVFILRRRNKGAVEGYKSPLYPWLQIFFIFVSLWMICFTLWKHPIESLLGLTNLVVGLGTYFLSRGIERRAVAKTAGEE